LELDEALARPRAELDGLAPRTLVWAAGGTRRQAALEGIPRDARYFEWAWRQQFAHTALFFDLGVTTLFAPALGPPQVREVGPYRQALSKALQRLGEDDSLAAYRKMGARVRFYGQQHLPDFAGWCERVERETAANGPRTLWWTMVVESNEEPLTDALRAALTAGARTLDEAVQAFYGEPVEPVEVFIGFGKPQTGYLMPPLLGERAALYWTGFPSYMLTEADLRTIFWDYRFARSTWSADKTNRYDGIAALGLAQRYGRREILGVGRRIGSFWHPAASSDLSP
jgi:hypothetical protein